MPIEISIVRRGDNFIALFVNLQNMLIVFLNAISFPTAYSTAQISTDLEPGNLCFLTNYTVAENSYHYVNDKSTSGSRRVKWSKACEVVQGV